MGEIDYSKPFKVRIIQDCRSPEKYGRLGKLDGHYGMCVGLYKYPDISQKAETSSVNPSEGNPLIRTQSGEYIWGVECWFDPEPDESKLSLKLQKIILEQHKAELREKYGSNDSGLDLNIPLN